MRLRCFYMGYAPPGTSPLEPIALAQEAERLGYDSAWAAEAWGTDCVTVLSWLGATTEKIKLGSAIMQIPGRTPANTAMTAATLDLLSGGRFLLGLGTSGPQVVEGWHGEPWGKPLEKTREYVEIVRTALRRELVEHHGEHYDIPLRQRHRPREAAEAHGAPASRGHPDLPGSDGAEGGRAGVRDRGRLAPDLLVAGEGAGAHSATSSRTHATGLRHRRHRTGDPHRRRRGRPRVPEAVLRPLPRRHGRARQELLQRPRVALRLRGRGARRSRTSTSTGTSAMPRRRSRTRSSTRSRSSGRRSASPSGSTRGASRARRRCSSRRSSPRRCARSPRSRCETASPLRTARDRCSGRGLREVRDALLEARRTRVLGPELPADEPAVDRLAEHGRLPERERLEPRTAARRLDRCRST